MNNLVLTKSSSIKHHAIECTSAIFIFSYVCATQKAPVCATQKAPTSYPLTPPTATVKLASDWLFVGLELRSFYYWTSTKIGNKMIDQWLLSKYGRVQSAESSLISITSSVYRGPIRPLAVG
jgi:hypothetical protein